MEILRTGDKSDDKSTCREIKCTRCPIENNLSTVTSLIHGRRESLK
jgi:hypothetical protein